MQGTSGIHNSSQRRPLGHTSGSRANTLSPPRSSSSSSAGAALLPSATSPRVHGYNPEDVSREQRDQDRRRRNVESAKRSRQRKQEEHRWVELQVQENGDRIRRLESEVKSLEAELKRPSRRKKPSSSRRNQNYDQAPQARPHWFGDAF